MSYDKRQKKLLLKFNKRTGNIIKRKGKYQINTKWTTWWLLYKHKVEAG